jgi:hypothetical protein
MASYLFPVLFPLALVGLGGLCVAARRAMRRAEDPSIGRGALLTALTGVPLAPIVRQKKPKQPDEQEG